jgi:hypothetical protein
MNINNLLPSLACPLVVARVYWPHHQVAGPSNHYVVAKALTHPNGLKYSRIKSYLFFKRGRTILRFTTRQLGLKTQRHETNTSFGNCYREGLKELIDEDFELLELATNAGREVKKRTWMFIVHSICNSEVQLDSTDGKDD